MSRYNRSVSRGSEDDYPFAVELPVPEGGFGTQLDVMRDWAKDREVIWTVGRNRFVAGQFFQMWRFKTEKDADTFTTTFGSGASLKEGDRGQRRMRGPRRDILF